MGKYTAFLIQTESLKGNNKIQLEKRYYSVHNPFVVTSGTITSETEEPIEIQYLVPEEANVVFFVPKAEYNSLYQKILAFEDSFGNVIFFTIKYDSDLKKDLLQFLF